MATASTTYYRHTVEGLDTIPTGSRELSARGGVRIPKICSHSVVLKPRESRSDAGMQAVRQVFTMCRAPNELIAAHGRPGAPLLPRTNDSAVVAPMMVVTAAISTRPLPKLMGEEDDAELIMARAKGSILMGMRLYRMQP